MAGIAAPPHILEAERRYLAYTMKQWTNTPTERIRLAKRIESYRVMIESARLDWQRQPKA